MYETRTRNKCDNHLQNDFEIYKAIDYFCFVCILDWKLHSAIKLKCIRTCSSNSNNDETNSITSKIEGLSGYFGRSLLGNK